MNMKCIVAAVASLVIFAAGQHPVKTRSKGKWVSLFNGKDLTGWTPKIVGYSLGKNFGNTFRVENGILSTRYNAYDSFRNRFGALYYQQPFSNYRLRFQYRFTGTTTTGGPSWGFKDGGVQYHCQSPATLAADQPFPVCLEYNLLGGDGVKERPTGEICASGMIVQVNGKPNTSYCTPPTVARTYPADDWVSAEIEVKGNQIRHFVNGEEVLLFTNPQYNPNHPQGSKFIKNGDGTVRSGYISIQSNSHPMDFKNIEIMEY